MSVYKSVFDKNIARVDSLLSLYIKLRSEDETDGKEYKLTDLLRTAVVFLHSAFEEYFRNVLIKWLPEKASEETLKRIPIALKAGKHNEKILLSDLSHYRDKTINDVIRESVAETIRLQSFNDSGEIWSWCSKLCLHVDKDKRFDLIDKAVSRRHKIVHEADTNRTANFNSERLQGIRPNDIQSWREAYYKFVEEIDAEIEKWEV